VLGLLWCGSFTLQDIKENDQHQSRKSLGHSARNNELLVSSCRGLDAVDGHKIEIANFLDH